MSSDEGVPPTDQEQDQDESAGPKEGAPPPFGETELDSPNRLLVAVDEVNDATKWAATVLGAAAAALLGAAPLLTGFEYETALEPLVRWLLAAAAAAVVAVSVVVVIRELVRMRRPLVTTLDDLPDVLKQRIEAFPTSYLPAGLRSLEGFRVELREWRRAASRWRHESRGLPLDSPEATRAAWAAEQLDIYLRARDRMVLEGALYAKLSQSGFQRRIYVASALAVAGLVSYIVVLSGDEPEPEAAAGPTAAVLIAYPDTYDRLLDGCAAVEPARASTDAGGNIDVRLGTPGIPVLLAAGDGSAEDPWKLQTFGASADCPAVSIAGSSAAGFEVVSLVPAAATASTTPQTPPTSTTDDG